MTVDRNNLRRGQGEFTLDLSALWARWQAYIRVSLVSSIAMAAALPLLTLDGTERGRLWTNATARFQLALHEGSANRPTVEVPAFGGPARVTADRLITLPAYEIAWQRGKRRSIGGLGIGLVLGFMGCAFWSSHTRDQGKIAGQDDLLRGPRVVRVGTLAKRLKPLLQQGWFKLARVAMPLDFANRHIALVATTGAGKTTAMREMMDQAERRGDACIIYDTSGEFIAHYYNPRRGDVILDPFDQRGCFWDLMAEASRHPADADQIAQKLVPDGSEHEDSVWTESARSLVANVMRQLIAEGGTRLADLVQALQSTPSEELGAWLKDTSSARIFTPNSERATASVLFSLTKALELIKFLKHEQASSKPFTFANYFANLDSHKGAKPWIFVPRRERYFEATKPLLACWLELASIGIMGLQPSDRRRIWMFLDELPDIPKVQNLQRLLPQGRKFGACVTITFQAIGQMRARYGVDAAEGLLANCNTKLFLQCADYDTREWASETCGQVEAELTSDSSSHGFELGRGQTTVGRQRQIRPAIMESEFKLEKFEGYLALPDGLPITKVKLSNAHIEARGPARYPGYVPGPVSDTLHGLQKAEHETSATIDYSQGPV